MQRLAAQMVPAALDADLDVVARELVVRLCRACAARPRCDRSGRSPASACRRRRTRRGADSSSPHTGHSSSRSVPMHCAARISSGCASHTSSWVSAPRCGSRAAPLGGRARSRSRVCIAAKCRGAFAPVSSERSRDVRSVATRRRGACAQSTRTSVGHARQRHGNGLHSIYRFDISCNTCWSWPSSGLLAEQPRHGYELKKRLSRDARPALGHLVRLALSGPAAPGALGCDRGVDDEDDAAALRPAVSCPPARSRATSPPPACAAAVPARAAGPARRTASPMPAGPCSPSCSPTSATTTSAPSR